jgi:hypothetical protein
MKRVVAYFVAIAGLVLLAAVILVNIVSISDAFGDGPPYFGRTTNMDKWRNPLPILAAVDGIAAIVVFIAGRWAYKRLEARRAPGAA